MSVPYPKQTKAELVRLLIDRDEVLAAERSAHEETKAKAVAIIRDLREQLAAAHDRQKFESMAYRAKLKKAAAAKRAESGESSFAERSAARKQAVAAYFAAYPDRKVVSDDELREFASA